jgi:hypothetical protein
MKIGTKIGLASIPVIAAIAVGSAGCRHAAAASKASISIAESGANDRRGDATLRTEIRPGLRTTIRGHVASAGSDRFDGYAFVSSSPCTVEFRLRPTLPGADLDLCAVDVASGRVRAIADGDGAEESGTIAIERAGVAIEIVVSSAWGSSGYTLEIEGVEPPAANGRPLDSVAPLARKHTIAKLEEYLGRGAGEEPASAAGVLPRLARLADRSALGQEQASWLAPATTAR